MFDLQTHRLPKSADELRRLAIRLGYTDADGEDGARRLSSRLQADDRAEPQDSRPSAARRLQRRRRRPSRKSTWCSTRTRSAADCSACWASIGFKDVADAYQNLMALAEEKIPFLSTRRCRHFLASIAPRLLAAIAETRRSRRDAGQPEQSQRLAGRQGRALGAVQLQPAVACAVRRAVRDEPVLVRHPDRQPRHDRRAVGQPAAGQAADAGAVASGAGRADRVRRRTSSRSCTASRTHSNCGSACATCWARIRSRRSTAHCPTSPSACVERIATREYDKLVAKFGEPMIASGDEMGRAAEFVIVALGKFGGRELNYHSDLDLIFLYEADGATFHAPPQQAQRRDDDQPAFLFASWRSGSSRSRDILGPTAGCTRSIRGCGRPDAAAGWPHRWPSSPATSPKARDNFGSGRRLHARTADLWQRGGRTRRHGNDHDCRLRPAVAAGVSPKRFARCGCGWKRRRARPISSAAPAASSISSFSCRCCNSSTAASSPRFASRTRWTRLRRCTAPA